MRFLVTVAFIACSLAAAQAQAADSSCLSSIAAEDSAKVQTENYVVKFRTAATNLRTGPGLGYCVDDIETSKGKEVRVVGSIVTWLKIQRGDKVLWVHRSLVAGSPEL